jgi:hypothetical protein
MQADYGGMDSEDNASTESTDDRGIIGKAYSQLIF